METKDGKYQHCRDNLPKAIWEDAKFRGVDFRAIGYEPGWYLEVGHGNQVLLATNYGQAHHAFSVESPSANESTRITTYTAQNYQHQLSVTIEGRECRDTMSRYNVTIQ